MAEYIGVDRASYSKWENGNQNHSKSNDRLIRLIYANLKGVNSELVGRFITEVFPEINAESDAEKEIRIDCRPYYGKIGNRFFESCLS